MPGAPIQLVSLGEQNVYLCGNPQITFFVAVYRRHTNFAIETIEEVFHTAPKFGGKTKVVLGNYGDLVHQMFLEIQLPTLNAFPDDGSYYVSWVNSIGHAIINNIEVKIGGTVIDRQYGQWLEIWGELTVPESKRSAYYDMIGHHDNFNANTQPGPVFLWIPLQFWFCRNVGLALPLVALQNQEVEIKVDFTAFDKLWVSSTGTFIQSTANAPQIYKASLWVDYIFLDNEERIKFAKQEHKYLIEQVQYNLVSVDINTFQNKIDLDFNHPVKELIWVIHDCVVMQPVANGGNEWFNYSDRPYTNNTRPEDPMIDAKLVFNGVDRNHEMSAKYYRVVQPYQYHTYTPNQFIYLYSFALKPEEHQPTGTANFSKLDSGVLNMTISSRLTDPQIIMFAPNYNILQIDAGMGGLLFSD